MSVNPRTPININHSRKQRRAAVLKKKKASARIKINRLLEEAGWRFFDDENGPANIQLEPNVKMSKADLTGLGENFDKVKNGLWIFCSSMIKVSLLLCWKKSRIKIPIVGKEQAREYAKSFYLKYVISPTEISIISGIFIRKPAAYHGFPQL